MKYINVFKKVRKYVIKFVYLKHPKFCFNKHLVWQIIRQYLNKPQDQELALSPPPVAWLRFSLFIVFQEFEKIRKWLFWSKNFATVAVSGQIDKSWPQGQKKNFVRLPSKLNTPIGQKDAESNLFSKIIIKGVIRGFSSFGVLSAFWSFLVSSTLGEVFLAFCRFFRWLP